MKLKYISWIPAVLLMFIIFMFSSKTAVESGENSYQIADGIVSLYENIYNHVIEETLRNDVLLKVDHIIRKMAHGFEYAVLSICVAFHLWACGLKRKKMVLLTIVFCAIYAATDELHQLFVPGRSCEVRDVFIDTTGATIGGFLYLLMLQLWQKYRMRIK